MPVFGFNTDVKVGDVVFHVQTEDRGVNHPVLDTTIYLSGRVVAKRAVNYRDFLASPDFNESELHSMVERQHKQMIEELRSGSLPELGRFGLEPEAGGISVQLLNPATFLQGTTATLQLLTTKRQGGVPVPEATLRLWLHTGTPQPYEFSGRSNQEGRLELRFHMPPLGPGGAELQIQATSPEGEDEIRYRVRARQKAGA